MGFNYLVEKKRMLNNLGCIRQTSGTCDGLECNKCPLSKCKNGYDLSCSTFEIKYPAEATEIVRKWAEEHPQMRKMLEHRGGRMNENINMLIEIFNEESNKAARAATEFRQSCDEDAANYYDGMSAAYEEAMEILKVGSRK